MWKRESCRAEQRGIFSTGSHKTDNILRTLFPRVMSLEQWIQHVDKADALTHTLVTSSDAASYLNLLRSTAVGITDNCRELRTPVSLSQVSHQREIILRAIQRVSQRGGLYKNVLTSGFAPMSDNPKASVSAIPNIEYRYPNSGVNRLQYNVWKTLLSRIGDMMMGHLLEETSVFIRVAKPAVYLQLTGEAVYQLWPYLAGSTLNARTLQPQHVTARSPKVKKSLKRPGVHKGHQKVESLENKTAINPVVCTSTGTVNNTIGCMHKGIKRPREEKEEDAEKHPGFKKLRTADNICEVHKVIDCNDRDISSEPHHLKPHDEIFAGELYEFKTAEESFAVSNKTEGTTTTQTTKESTTKVHRTVTTFNLKRTIVFDGGSVGFKSQSKLLNTRNEPVHQINNNEHTVIATQLDTGSLQKRKTSSNDLTEAKKRKVGSEVPKKRCHKWKRNKNTRQKRCSENIQPYRYHKYVPRLSLLYGRNLREMFPDSFSLATLEPSEKGARQLMADIFVKTDVGGNILDRGQPCQCQSSLVLKKQLFPLVADRDILKHQTAEREEAVNNLQTHECKQKKSQSSSEKILMHVAKVSSDLTTVNPVCTQPPVLKVLVAERTRGLNIDSQIKRNVPGCSSGCNETAGKRIFVNDDDTTNTGMLRRQMVLHYFDQNNSDSLKTQMEDQSSDKKDSDYYIVSSSEASSDASVGMNHERTPGSSSSIPCGQVSKANTSKAVPDVKSYLVHGFEEYASNSSQNSEGNRFDTSSTVRSVSSTAVKLSGGTNALDSTEVQRLDQSSSIDLSPDIVPPSPCTEASQSGISKCLKPTLENDQAVNSLHTPPSHVCPEKLWDNSSKHEISCVLEQPAIHTSADTAPFRHSVSPLQISNLSRSTCNSSSSLHTGSSGYEISEFSSKPNSIEQSGSASSGKVVESTTAQCHPSFYNPENTTDTAMACLSVTLVHAATGTVYKSGGCMHKGVSDGVATGSADHLKLPSASVSCGTITEDHELQSGKGETDATMHSSLCLFSSSAEQHVLPLLQQVLYNHRKCPYRALLNHHCGSKFGSQDHSVSRKKRRKNTNKTVFSTCRLLEDTLPPHKVFAFLQAVLKRVVPAQLYGPTPNKALFLKNVRSLLSSGKFEKVCLGQLMRSVKVKGCAWLHGVSCQKEREHHMAQLVWWVFVYFVLHVIKTFFYATDTTVFRNRVLYYRKQTWLRLQTKAMQDFKKSAKLKCISETEVTSLLESKQSLGVSVLRFLPKTQSLRPIVNMSSKPKLELLQMKSINKQLLNLLHALTFEKTVNRSIYGCSVFGLDDIHTAFRQFVQHRSAQRDTRPLYFVKTDISKCFDSIQQSRLYSIIEGILMKDGEQTYVTRKYVSVVMTGQRLKRSFHQDTKRLSHFQPDFFTFARQRSAGGRLSDIILVDQVLCQQDSSKSLLQLLSSHLFKNIIKMGRCYYLQQTGVSQGSVVSSLLASIYLAHLENSHLSMAPGELLVRMMDDYLLLTPDRPQAERFLTLMVEGFPEYNCFTNGNKILTNFTFEHPALGTVEHTQQGEHFPWCGLLIDTASLEVAVDYSRYSGLSVTDTVSFDASYKPGHTLRNKLLMCLKIKCHVIFFDPEINSEEKLLMNAYQAFLYLARVFHTFVTKLPASQRVSSNLPFFCSIAQTIPQFLYWQVTKRLKQVKGDQMFPVSVQVLQWLCADAFLVKLNKFAGYKKLRKCLRRNKVSIEKRMDGDQVSSLREIHNTGVTLDSAVTLL